MNTLLLDRDAWDLCLDAQGNIAMASLGYALSQDAASAARQFKGEYIYDVTSGIPYFDKVLGKLPSLNYIRSKQIAAALTVPEVAAASVYFTSIAEGSVAGQIQVTDTSGTTTTAGFTL